MSEYRSNLERAAERVTPRQDALERLANIRTRRRRRRRIRAGVVAFVVAAGGLTAGLISFSGPGRERPATDSTAGFPAPYPRGCFHGMPGP